jgi:hypothetical protein
MIHLERHRNHENRSGNRGYPQIVANPWGHGPSQQRVIATIVRLDEQAQNAQGTAAQRGFDRNAPS